jgi:hypothetical protein
MKQAGSHYVSALQLAHIWQFLQAAAPLLTGVAWNVVGFSYWLRPPAAVRTAARLRHERLLDC